MRNSVKDKVVTVSDINLEQVNTFHYTNTKNTGNKPQLEGYFDSYDGKEYLKTFDNAASRLYDKWDKDEHFGTGAFLTVIPVVHEGLAPNSIETSSLIGLDDLRSDPRFSNIDGRGQAVVVLDTGIDLDHPAFGPDNNGDGISDRIVYQYDFSGTNDADASDKSNHGSNVSSIIGSENPSYLGVAPGVDIIHLKVFGDSGSGSFGDIQEALNWVVDNHQDYNIASVNMSLTDTGNYDISQTKYGIYDEIEDIKNLGITVVVAAGNEYETFGSQGVGYPAADPNVIAVGAVYDSGTRGYSYSGGARAFSSDRDRLTPFSQRDDELLTVFAPGAPIKGANKSGGSVTMHGTSQAAPVITGVVALAQQIAKDNLNRQLLPDEIESLLQSTAVTINDGDDEDDNVSNTGLDFPRVDVYALAQEILTLDSKIAINYDLTAFNHTYTEGDSGYRTISLVLDRDYTINPTSVNYDLSLSTASLGSDFEVNGVYGNGITYSGNKINFDSDAGKAYINIRIFGDEIFEPDENITVEITNATNKINGSDVNFSISGSPLTVTIEDDDTLDMKESIVGEVGTLKTSTRKTTIHLENSYTNPVIITSLGGNGWEPYTNRISNIKEDSFDIRIQEPSTGTSPGHTSEISSYMVIEAGVYALEDGSKIQAGTIPSSKTRPHQFPIVNLDKSFDNPDTMLFSQVQSSNGGDWVYSRIHAKEGSRFRVGLQEEELLRHTGHTTEEIGFVALLAGDNSDSFFTKKTTFSNKTFIKTDKDALFAESTSLDGMDPFVTRIDPIDNGYSLRLQEEQSYDLETVHIAESFNIFGADIGNLVSVI